jgi:serine protease Do
VAVVGYPLDQPETLTAGTVSGLNRTITVAGYTRTGMIETDTPINPGNSGGPLIAADGHVVGLVDALETNANGIGYAVNGLRAAQELAAWQASPSPQSPGTCTDAVGPSQGGSNVGPPAAGPEVTGIINTLSAYFAGIDTADYAETCAQLTPANAGSDCLAHATSGFATSYDFNFNLLAITQVSPGVDIADLDFTSIQDPSDGPNGDMCDNWTLAYRLVNTNGSWLIAEAVAQNGSTHSSC